MSKLKTFLEKEMKMTGPYQPLVIKELLKNNGRASLIDIAKAIAPEHPDTIEYLVNILKVWPRATLKSRGIAVIPNRKDYFELLEPIEKDEVKDLIALCDQKVSEWKSRPIKESTTDSWGRIRALMLTKEPFCQICGAAPPGTKHKKVVLDVDHIIPRIKGGGDDVTNLQVLCSQCNRGLNDETKLSAKEARERKLTPIDDCPFCSLNDNSETVIKRFKHLTLIWDNFPVNKGHMLVVPTQHLETPFDFYQIHFAEIWEVLQFARSILKLKKIAADGFNIGFNVAEAGGQTGSHAHLHIIPILKIKSRTDTSF